jgi:hypothetical protein
LSDGRAATKRIGSGALETTVFVMRCIDWNDLETWENLATFSDFVDQSCFEDHCDLADRHEYPACPGQARRETMT